MRNCGCLHKIDGTPSKQKIETKLHTVGIVVFVLMVAHYPVNLKLFYPGKIIIIILSKPGKSF